MRWGHLVVLLLIACSGVDPTIPGDATKRAEVERDLVVVLARTGAGSEPMDADATWPIAARLVNRGAHAHWIVRSADGSGMGWREPHVFYTAEMEVAPDVWGPVPQRDDYRRCGRYATDWYSDVAELRPGESIELEGFIEPDRLLELSRSGRIRLRAHYQYDGGQKRSFRYDRARVVSTPPKELDAVGPFAIVSAPIDLEVTVDTRVELSLARRRVRPLRVGEPVSLAELVDASVANRSAAPVDLGEDFPDSRFHLDVKGGGFAWGLNGPRQLEARERVTLHSSATFVPDEPGTVSFRLRYDGVQPSGLRRYRSPWVDLEVTPSSQR